ncbi:GAF domain-containing sensor histidine kinase [Bradyrhizobium sp. McL0616]|uniref:GAF domain-containing sensor histidine kinase n=1 Tax=Bradyrhizobium sp. McL0616 TaxID=3415674 RepID=UPI003CF131D1
MAKTKRKAGKRTTAGPGGLRARKSGVSIARKPGLREPKPAKTDLGKRKPSRQPEIARLKRQLKAARMQLEAGAEIQRAVANASGDTAGPLQLIAETTAGLFKASSVSIQLAEGSEFTREYRVGAIAKRVGSAYPRSNIKVGGRNLPGTVVAESRQIHIPDLDHLDPSMSDFPGLPHARAGGARTVCGTPLRRDGKAIGALIVFRDRLLPFTDEELALLQSFADQAVIAIENARLFNETKQALERQTATADILRIISRSVAHAAPVFDTILESCQRLFNPYDAAVYLVEGDRVRGVARRGPGVGDWGTDSMPLAGSSTGLAISQRQPLHFPDLADKTGLPEDKRDAIRLAGGMSVLYAPIISESRGVGSLVVTRQPKKPFTETEIEFIQSFADQAAIAIENARLFNEVEAKTRDLTESLQQQTATSEVLAVISRSPSDLKPVLQAISDTAARLCGSEQTMFFRYDGDVFRILASWNFPPQVHEMLERRPLMPGHPSAIGRAGATLKPVCIPDVLADPAYGLTREQSRARYRATLAVPLLREGKLVGALSLNRSEPGAFNEKQIELVATFADQAVIAIENTRLFNETKEALAYQTGSSNVLRVIASSPTDVEPVLKEIVESARELCEASDAVVLLKDAEYLHFSAHSGPIPVTLDKWPISRNWTAGRAFVDQKPVHVHDMLSGDGAEFPDARAMGQSTGSTIHTVLSVPLLLGNESIGAILLRRTEVRPFNDKQINLLSTFADQAVIAIQNARLFNETKEALERQTATADILKVIASSPSDLQPVFEAIAERSNRLVSGLSTTVLSIVDDTIHLSAFTRTNPQADAALTASFPRQLSAMPFGGPIRQGAIYSLPDTETEPVLRDLARMRGYRSMLFVPLLRDGAPIGMIGQTRVEPGPFAVNHIQLLKTFADQAVIAISNVRLFQEVRERTRELSQSLDDLRTAQDRLVQTEKLASLGQLTAGIAHEIKNPLNFVNNFSALSVELIDEMTDVFENPALDEAGRRKELDEIRELLKSNLEKVVQHGKRADSIVKNMLLHSREGSGEQRAVDINALLDESLNLAYHGARAEKPGFNITLQRDLDPDAGVIELFPQEITRALLNLISNGFYAASKREAENGEADFEPVLSAATKNLGSHIEIRIRDNGTGIPPEVKEKMFNPFFTTKPAGEGTGLGLSMSHDIIVKQHGGRIEVDTQPGQFTEFTIVLPRATTPADNRKD